MKKNLLFLVKTLVSAGLIWYLLAQTEFSSVYSAMRTALPGWLLLSFSLLYVGKVLTSYRWQVLLAAQGIHIPLRTLIASVFVGQFFNSFLPTTVGGDAIRAYDTAAHSQETAKSIMSVFADRLIGVFALALLALLGLVVAWFSGQDVAFYITPVLVVFLICALGILTVFNRRLVAWFERAMRSLRLGKLADRGMQAYRSVHELRDMPGALLIAFLVSVALQINVVLFYYFIGLSLTMGVSLLFFFIIVPVALVVLIIPVSINGVGLREGIFVFLLTALAVPTPEAIALSWLSFGLTLTQGVLGGIIFALRGLNLRQSRHSILKKNPPVSARVFTEKTKSINERVKQDSGNGR
ncbi:MAG TPA: lysylphosphatidylglycerol synthase transmembrane domain-containing protein [Anaerolineales bacterium]|nr:lysylphosphatidylglycerol synthase transmembrane domain-containing protein [Anaerolineales bacterium]